MGNESLELYFSTETEKKLELKAREKVNSNGGIVIVNDEEALEINSERIPAKTKKKTSWCLSVLN